MRAVLFFLLFSIAPCARAVRSPVNYTIYPEDILSVRACGSIVGVSLAQPDSTAASSTEFAYKFVFTLPRDISTPLVVAYTGWSPTKLSVYFRLPDKETAIAFATFLQRRQIRPFRSNQTMKLTATVPRFGDAFSVATFLSPQIRLCAGGRSLSYSR
jgi:hypothetical protein